MRLDYVSCNSIANDQFESTNLYVCIRLMQPFHRFVSGPLRLDAFRATLPQVLKHAIRSLTFALRLITFVLTFLYVLHRLLYFVDVWAYSIADGTPMCF